MKGRLMRLLVMTTVVAVLVLPFIAVAQESTAGQGNDAQVNWSALRAQIDLVSSQNKVLADTLDKYNVCSAKKMIYMQSAVGPANTDGCVSPAATCTPTATVLPAGATNCPAGSQVIVTSASATGTGNGTHNSPYMTYGGVATTKACLKVVCE